MAALLATRTDTLPVTDPISPLVFPPSPRQNNGDGQAMPERCRCPTIALTPRPEYHPWATGPTSKPRESSMPVSTGSQSLLASLPSFMSVFGDGSDNHQSKEVSAAATQPPNRSTGGAKRPSSSHQPFSTSFRRDSASTFESVESSPTTTISTVESSITEPSPSSSPESPSSALPLPGLKTYRTHSSPAVHTVMESQEQFSSSFPLLPGLERIESPNKKMRNTKNLSVNTAASNRQGSQLSKIAHSNAPAGPTGHASSAPPTPAFIVPPKAPRKKPSNLGLTITTPDSGSSNPPDPRSAIVPQTPSDPQLRTLRLLQTPSSGQPFSPTHAPEGGMRLPPISSGAASGRFGKASRPPLSVSPLSSFDTTTSSPITKQTLDHVQEETDYDPPLSQEVKSPAYPQGPVCIYEPNIYLYLEPTQVEAREFDVVFNVAREVKNPFSKSEDKPSIGQVEGSEQTKDDECSNKPLAGREMTFESQTITSESSGGSVPDSQSDAALSVPSTPKAIRPEPEYIHIPWDHNTNVVDDLLRLCQQIEDRERLGKRVLIHCQCGVSRSASLVVAYGIYKNPQLTVQEAYDAVKNRSRWIGPNMNLIYQLSEFKTKLKMRQTAAPMWQSWRTVGTARSASNSTLTPDDLPRQPTSARSIPQKSLSAPSHMENGFPLGRTNSFGSSGSTNLTVRATTGDITPGPSSAPPNVQWSSQSESKTMMSSLSTLDTKNLDAPPVLSLMDIDSSLSLSPVPLTQDPITEKETPPVGGVASDLQEVARDLNERSTPEPIEAPPLKLMNIDVPKQDPVVEGEQTHPEAPKPAISNLPAGFSSLLTRRQAAHRLPLRQEVPRFNAPQIPPTTFRSVLHDEVPPTPSILSPRAAEFTASPFHRTAAGDLAGSSVFEQGLMSPTAVDEDPRSPHQRGEAPIVRSIFDILSSRGSLK